MEIDLNEETNDGTSTKYRRISMIEQTNIIKQDGDNLNLIKRERVESEGMLLSGNQVRFIGTSSIYVDMTCALQNNLVSLVASDIKNSTVSFRYIANQKSLSHLEIKFDFLGMIDSFVDLMELKRLTYVSLLNTSNATYTPSLETLEYLTELRALELGPCSDVTVTWITQKMCAFPFLYRLRMETSFTENIPNADQVLEAASVHTNLKILELINFGIGPNIEKPLMACKNLESLMFIPHYSHLNGINEYHLLRKALIMLAPYLEKLVWSLHAGQNKNTETSRMLKTDPYIFTDNYDDKSACIVLVDPKDTLDLRLNP